MFKNFDLFILTIILSIITVILVVMLLNMEIKQSSMIIIFSLLSIPLYKICKQKQANLKQNTFWTNYWHDMQCKLPIILYGISAAGFIVWINK